MLQDVHSQHGADEVQGKEGYHPGGWPKFRVAFAIDILTVAA